MRYVAAWYLALSLITLAAFALDKRAAARGGRRTHERTLHLLELLGGWPGALVAMQLVRHKRRKPAYWLATAAIATAHLALWVFILWPRAGHSGGSVSVLLMSSGVPSVWSGPGE